MQLLAPQWWPDAKGKKVVESKEDLRSPKRLGRSPDDADAMNLAYANRDRPQPLYKGCVAVPGRRI
jgi:hypothetical protein